MTYSHIAAVACANSQGRALASAKYLLFSAESKMMTLLGVCGRKKSAHVFSLQSWHFHLKGELRPVAEQRMLSLLQNHLTDTTCHVPLYERNERMNCKCRLMKKGDLFFFYSYQIFLIKTQFSSQASSSGHFPSTMAIYFAISCEQFFYFFNYKPWCQIHILRSFRVQLPQISDDCSLCHC